MDDVMSDVSNELVDSYQCVMREMWGPGRFWSWGGAGLRGAVTVDNAGVCAEYLGLMTLFKRG